MELITMKRSTAIAAAVIVSMMGISASLPSMAQTPGSHGPGQMMQNRNAQPGRGMTPEMMGPMMRQMMRHMMGPGHMMGPPMRRMMGRGMMGSLSGFSREKPLSNDDVRRIVDGRLAQSGLSRLKAGAVKDDGKSAKVDIVTPKDELIFRLKVNRATGRAAITE
jgi:hypothetical protein